MNTVNYEEKNKNYYTKVAKYYDQEATLFETHYRNNVILQRLRNDFRAITEKYTFRTALEIGCGPGIDLEYFAKKNPDLLLRGIDVSQEMVKIANTKLNKLDRDAYARVATPETLPSCFPDPSFEMIYCYFGALNTVADLSKTATVLRTMVSENGTMVLTFVNKWFLFEIMWNIFRLRFRKAWARLQPVWPGYSPERPLESICRSAREIDIAFSPHFSFVRKKGYSIVFPAWYRHRFISTSGAFGNLLWKMDTILNKTPFWNLGEYSLYVLKPK